jgi:MOSC domain-containing protein YiiM
MTNFSREASVHGIYLAQTVGEPVQDFSQASAVKGDGLYSPAGWPDRYPNHGAYSKSEAPGGSRDITIIGREAILAALEAIGNDELTEEQLAALTRRQIVVDGFGPVLQHLIGSILANPDTGLELEVTGDCKPCARIGHLATKAGLSGLDFTELLGDGRGGVRARITESGMIAVENRLVVIDQ